MKSEKLLDIFNTFIDSKYVYLFFFFAAFIIFSPFFIYQEYIVSTTDSIFCHYPNLIFGHEALRHGHLPLWNPYLFAGTDFTTSMHHHMLNPANWLLLLVPTQYLFHALTFIEFVQISFIGVFAFKTFLIIFRNRLSSFAASLVVQLSGFTWFVTTTFIGVELFFLSILFIYLIVTYSNRRTLTNFIFMAIINFGMFAVGHVGYVIAFLFPVIACQLFFHRKSLFRFKNNPTVIFALAMAFGFSMSLYRILPVLLGIHHIVQQMFPGVYSGGNAYLLLTGAIPTIFGIYLGRASSLLNAVGGANYPGWHTQFHSLIYFGMPTIFFFFLSLSHHFRKHLSTIAWLTLLVVIGTRYAFQPAADILYFIFTPFSHPIIFRTGIAFLFFSLFASAFNRLNNREGTFSNNAFRILLILFGVVICTSIGFYLHVNFQLFQNNQFFYILGRASITILFILSIIGSLLIHKKKKLLNTTANTVILSSIALFLFSSIFAFSYYKHPFFHSIALYFLGAILWMLTLLLVVRRSQVTKKGIMVLIGTILVCLYVLIFQLPGIYHFVSESLERVLLLFALSAFCITFFTLMIIFFQHRQKKITNKNLRLILTLFLIGDLLFFTKIYSYVGGPSFVKKQELYPQLSKHISKKMAQMLIDIDLPLQPSNRHKNLPGNLDIKNFRVNNPGAYLESPYSSAFSSSFMKYKIRTYGGVDSVINQDLSNYLANLDAKDPASIARFGILPVIQNERVLDLFGARYNFTEPNTLLVRPNAFSRFASFSNYVTEKSLNTTYQLIKSSNFPINTTLIINSAPKFPLTKREPLLFQPIDYESTDSNHITLTINNPAPHLLLFNDSFNPGWTAKWNSEPIPVLLADGYFMAVSLPAGKGVLTFSFQPKLFLFWGKFSIILVSILFLLAIYCVFTRKKNGSHER